MSARWVFPILFLLIILLALEAMVQAGLIAQFILPAPSQVLLTLWDDRNELLSATLQTLVSSLSGLVISFLLGNCLAMIMAISKTLRFAILPYAVFFQTVPIIAIAPLLVIWFGFGPTTVIASAAIVSIFPIIANSIHGLTSVDRMHRALFKVYRASKMQELLKLQIPSALPEILLGLRVASGLAVIGAIVGEFIAGSGLGAVVDVARTQQRVDKVFAAIVMSSLLGLVLVGITSLLQKLLIGRWHTSQDLRD